MEDWVEWTLGQVKNSVLPRFAQQQKGIFGIQYFFQKQCIQLHGTDNHL